MPTILSQLAEDNCAEGPHHQAKLLARPGAELDKYGLETVKTLEGPRNMSMTRACPCGFVLNSSMSSSVHDATLAMQETGVLVRFVVPAAPASQSIFESWVLRRGSIQ